VNIAAGQGDLSDRDRRLISQSERGALESAARDEAADRLANGRMEHAVQVKLAQVCGFCDVRDRDRLIEMISDET
jgi:hypothetical protein